MYGSLKEYMMLMAKAAECFTKNPTRTSSFHALSFYKVAKVVLTDLRELYTLHSSVDHAFFQSFRVLKLQATQGSSPSLMTLFLNNMRLFDYNAHDMRKRWEERAAFQQKCMIACVEKSLVPGNEGKKASRVFISATEEGQKLCVTRLWGVSKVPEKECG